MAEPMPEPELVASRQCYVSAYTIGPVASVAPMSTPAMPLSPDTHVVPVAPFTYLMELGGYINESTTPGRRGGE